MATKRARTMKRQRGRTRQRGRQVTRQRGRQMRGGTSVTQKTCLDGVCATTTQNVGARTNYNDLPPEYRNL